MVLNRLSDSQSKLGVSEWTETVYRPEFENFQLQHYYKALDFARQNMPDKLEQKLNKNGPKSLVSNRGYRRYLKVKGKSVSVSIDREIIKKEERFDGK